MKPSCVVNGCESPGSGGKGYCPKHYYRWKTYGDPHKLLRESSVNDGPCSIVGCTSPAHSRGWCHTHYNRWHRWGDPNTVMVVLGDDRTRFWLNVSGTDPLGCWHWTGRLDEGGYGVFPRNTGSARAHRFAYEQMVAEIPVDPTTGKSLGLDHTCHTDDEACPGGHSCLHRRCVNPWHLEPVTQLVNFRRGRHYAGDLECNRGHSWADHLRRGSDGKRYCGECHRLRIADWRRRNPSRRTTA